MVQWASSIEPLSEESKTTLTSMMEHLSESHYQAAQAAQNLADLSKTCSSSQLMTIIKFAVRPLVQLEGTLGCMGEETTRVEKGRTFRTKLRTESTLHSCQTQKRTHSRGSQPHHPPYCWQVLSITRLRRTWEGVEHSSYSHQSLG